MPPPFLPPLTRGLSNAQHLTGGEILPFLSLRHALRRATSLARGRNNGSSSRHSLRTYCIFIFQSERSRPFPTIFHYSSFIFGSSRTPTPTHEIQFAPTNPNLYLRKKNFYVTKNGRCSASVFVVIPQTVFDNFPYQNHLKGCLF